MRDQKTPRLGCIVGFGAQLKVFTHRGWVICDDTKEIEDELRLIKESNSKKTALKKVV